MRTRWHRRRTRGRTFRRRVGRSCRTFLSTSASNRENRTEHSHLPKYCVVTSPARRYSRTQLRRDRVVEYDVREVLLVEESLRLATFAAPSSLRSHQNPSRTWHVAKPPAQRTNVQHSRIMTIPPARREGSTAIVGDKLCRPRGFRPDRHTPNHKLEAGSRDASSVAREGPSTTRWPRSTHRPDSRATIRRLPHVASSMPSGFAEMKDTL